MSKHIFLYAMKKADKREKIQEFKDELDERADVLNGVMKQIKEDKDTDSEKKEELLKKIKKNRKVMEKVSTILGKNPRKQDE